MAGSGFALTKWYLDCIDGDGRTAIVYWSALSWGGLAVTWHNVSIYEDGRAPFVRTGLEQVPSPQAADGEIAWMAPAIDTRIVCRPHTPPYEQLLLGSEERGLRWRCEAASGDTVVECRGHAPVEGRGYAECLTLTLPPWQIPIQELRWGRWIAHASTKSVVWIEWRGPNPLTLVLRDGALVPDASVTDAGIVGGGSRVDFEQSERLYVRSLSDTLGRAREFVAPIMPARWLSIEDAKWRRVGTLRDHSGAVDRGWIIHEQVVFP